MHAFTPLSNMEVLFVTFRVLTMLNSFVAHEAQKPMSDLTHIKRELKDSKTDTHHNPSRQCNWEPSLFVILCIESGKKMDITQTWCKFLRVATVVLMGGKYPCNIKLPCLLLMKLLQ
jgi:hypothetical protein